MSAELDALVAACKLNAADPHAAKTTQAVAKALGVWAPTVGAVTPTPPTPPTPPPVSGTLSFVGDFTTGDGSQWNEGIECDSVAAQSASFKVVTGSQYPQGHAGRFTLRQGYSAFGWKENAEAAQSFTDQVQGSRFFYGWHFTMPAGSVAPKGWLLPVQFYTLDFPYFVGPPPIGIDAGSNQLLANFNTGQAKLTNGKPNGSYAYNNRLFFYPKPIYTGNTFTCIFDVAYSKNADGHFDVYTVAGDKLAGLDGIPTLRFDPGYNGGTADPIGLVKLGGYRDSYCNADSSGNIFGPNGQHTPGTCFLGQSGSQPDTICDAGLWRGDTFDAVAAHFG